MTQAHVQYTYVNAMSTADRGELPQFVPIQYKLTSQSSIRSGGVERRYAHLYIPYLYVNDQDSIVYAMGV